MWGKFKSRPEDLLSGLSPFVVFLSPSMEMLGYYLKLGHDCLLPHHFQFIIHLSSFHRRYIVWATESVFKLTINKYDSFYKSSWRGNKIRIQTLHKTVVFREVTGLNIYLKYLKRYKIKSYLRNNLKNWNVGINICKKEEIGINKITKTTVQLELHNLYSSQNIIRWWDGLNISQARERWKCILHFGYQNQMEETI
jgi:hypothetical protein